MIGQEFEPITSEYLNYDEVMEKFDTMMDYVSKVYIKALNLSFLSLQATLNIHHV